MTTARSKGVHGSSTLDRDRDLRVDHSAQRLHDSKNDTPAPPIDAAPGTTGTQIDSSAATPNPTPHAAVDTARILEQLAERRTTHGVATCRWCRAPFVLVYGAQWFCPTPACTERQFAHAIVKRKALQRDGESPFLFVPLPLQVEMRTSTVKRLLVAGAAGACKSYGARWDAYARALAVPGSQILLLRCSFPELAANHTKYMPAECDALGVAKYVGGNTPQVRFDNGSLITMGYSRDEADVQTHMGSEHDAIYLEEANSLLPNAITMIPTRDRGSFVAQRPPGVPRDGRTLLLANPIGRGMLTLIDHYITKNPDPAEFPAYNPEIHGFIHATLDDNPYLPENYASTTLSGLSSTRYKALRWGDWTVRVGGFFESFESDVHVTNREVAA